MAAFDTLTHPILVLIRGVPGSGKSYLAAELKAQLGEAMVVMLDPDAIDFTSEAYAEHVRQATAEGVDPALFPYRFLRAQAYRGIEDRRIIVWNQPFTNLDIFDKMIARLRDHAAASGVTLPILVVEVELDAATAKTRVITRKQQGGHGPSDHTFALRADEYSSASARGYDVLPVQGNTDVSENAAVVAARITELGNAA